MKKMNKKILLIAIFLTIIFQNIVLIKSEEDRIIRMKELNLDSKETYIPVKSGQKFTIEIEGNPSTGYSWFLETPEKIERSGLLKATNLNKHNSGDYYRSSELNKNETEVLRVGSGGLFHFKFLAGEKSGHEEITFIYKRPWDEEDQIKKTIIVKVINTQEKQNDL